MNKSTISLMSIASAGFASGAVVIPTGVEAFHQGDRPPGDVGSITRVIDGTGIAKADATDPSTWTINSTAWQDDWQGFSNDNTGNNTWVVFDLGAPVAYLDEMFLWNVQESGALNRGTNGFDIYHATSPTVPPPATPSGAPGVPYDFSSGGWTAAGSGILNQGTQIGDSGQSFDVSAASGARYIGLHITSNHNGNRTGLAEVAFTTPEPSSTMLLLLGGVAGAVRRRR